MHDGQNNKNKNKNNKGIWRVIWVFLCTSCIGNNIHSLYNLDAFNEVSDILLTCYKYTYWSIIAL